MNKKNTPNRRRINDPRLNQPREFIVATGYGNNRFNLDTEAVSFQVSAANSSNLKVGKEAH